jgi:hypothetical protein
MLYRVKVNVVSAPLKIPIIANGMFPKTLLPKRIFTAMIAGNWNTCSDSAARETTLDPPIRKIRAVRCVFSETPREAIRYDQPTRMTCDHPALR